METAEIIKSLREISNMRSTSNYKRTICKMAAQRLEKLTAELEQVKAAPDDGRFVDYLPGDTVYDRFGMAWMVTTSEIHKFGDGPLRYLYRCGHPGTDDYCALYADEILTREEAETALKVGDSNAQT